MNKLEKTKKLFKGVQLSTYIIVFAFIIIIISPYVNKLIQVQYKGLSFKDHEFAMPYVLLAVGILIRFIDKWKGTKLK